MLHKLKNTKVFSKLDGTSGFHQIPLDKESSKYTTFITPIGRFKCNRLPFGISSASEIFQRTMETILKDIKNAMSLYDDTLVFGEDQDEHNQAVKQVLVSWAHTNTYLHTHIHTHTHTHTSTFAQWVRLPTNFF